MADEQEVLISLENLKEYHAELLDMLPGEIWIGRGDPNEQETEEEQIFGVDTAQGKFYYKSGKIWYPIEEGSIIETATAIKFKDPDNPDNKDYEMPSEFQLSGNDKEFKIKFIWQCLTPNEKNEFVVPIRNKGTVEIYVRDGLKETFTEYSSTDKREVIIERDLMEHLQTGKNEIKIVIRNSYGEECEYKFSVYLIVLTLTGSDIVQNEPFFQKNLSGVSAVIKNIDINGPGAKTGYVYIDGVLQEETYSIAESAKSFEIKIPTKEKDTGILCHGSYFIEVYVVSDIKTDVRSNSLFFDFIYVDDVTPKNTAIIASPFSITKALQYEKMLIPFYIYKGGAKEVAVRFSVTKKEYNENEELIEREVSEPKVQLYKTGTPLEWEINYSEEMEKDSIHNICFKIEVGSYSEDLDHNISFENTEDKKEFNIEITQREIPEVLPINDNLGISFIAEKTAINNQDSNREEWISTGKIKPDGKPIKMNFGDFDWTNGGWTTIEERPALRLTNGSKLEIPYKIFKQSSVNINDALVDTTIIKKGLTIEVDVNFSNVIDSTAPFFTCFGDGIGITISPTEATLSNGIETTSTKYENSKSKRYQNSMHFTFVITNEHKKTVTNNEGKDVTTYLGGMYIYINGIGAAAQEYSRAQADNSEKFVHNENAYFYSEGCDVDLFGFRMYYSGFDTFQILNNWIADMNISNRIQAYITNALFDKEESKKVILFEEAKKQIPCMIITGDRPQFKTDKKIVDIEFVGTENELFDFTLDQAQIDVQGTSSQYYPVKNWKFKASYKLKDGTKVKQKFYYPRSTGKSASETYSLSDKQIPSSVFCLKADYMETSSTHNTVTANLAHSIYDSDKDYGKTPPQRKDSTGRVRTTIYGRPILVFYKDTKSSSPVFGGKFNFNYDKDSEEVFGFVPPKEGTPEYKDFELIECVEFKENRDELGLFTGPFYDPKRKGAVEVDGKYDLIEIAESDVDNYDERDIITTEGKFYIPRWAKAFEFRAYYRKEDDGEPTTRRAYLQAVSDWVYSLNANTATNENLSKDKQADFTKGSANYEYDLDMNKVTFKYAPKEISKEKEVTRNSLDLGSKVPQEFDYQIETYYEVTHTLQEEKDSKLEINDIISPKIYSKEDWEKKVLVRDLSDFSEEKEYADELQYNIKYINKQSEDSEDDVVIYNIAQSRKDWEREILESPDELEYVFNACIEVNYMSGEQEEPLKTETYIKEDFDENKLKLPEGATHYNTVKYYEVKYINKISTKTLKTIKYSLDEWKNFDFEQNSTKNLVVELEKFYILKYDNKKITYTQEEWENIILNFEDIDLNLTEEESSAIQDAINESQSQGSKKTYSKKIRIYYALLWVPDELNNPDTYNKGKELYRFNKDSRNYRLSRFKSEFSEHFNEHFCIMYFILMEMLGMIDSSTKNMFWATWGERHEKHPIESGDKVVIWYPIFYDMDTILGIDNVGKMQIPYNVEYDSVASNGKHIYNGYGNVFWENFRVAFQVEIGDKLREKINNGTLSQERILKQYEDHSNNFCEYVYNEDGDLKILDVYFDGYDVVTGYKEDEDGNKIPVKRRDYANWMHVYQGDRYYYRNFWFPNRFNYICSKNRAGNYVNDYISMRLNDPRLTSAGNIDVNYDFNIETWKDQYVRIKYGGFSISKIFTANQEDVIISPQKSYNDTETAIYGASNIKSIGNISNKYANSIKLEQASRLLYFDAGNDEDNYENNLLERVSFGSNTMLQRVNLCNCRALTTNINLGACPNIKEVLLKNTSIEEVQLPSKGKLEKLLIPKTITNLIITDQPKLKYFEFPCDTINDEEQYNLETLKITGTPFLETKTQEMVEKSIDNKLKNLTLTDINWYSEDKGALLIKILDRCESDSNPLKGEGKNRRPVLQGYYEIDELPTPIEDRANLYFNEVENLETLDKDFNKRLFRLKVNKQKEAYNVFFKNYNGEQIESNIPGNYVIKGDPIEYKGETPQKQEEWDRQFEFTGWIATYDDGTPDEFYANDEKDPSYKPLPRATKNVIFIAQFKTVFKPFTFKFIDSEGGKKIPDIILYSEIIDKGGNSAIFNKFGIIENIIEDYDDTVTEVFGKYFLGWKRKGTIIYDTDTVCDGDLVTVTKDLYEKNKDNENPYIFTYQSWYTEEQICLVTFKDFSSDQNDKYVSYDKTEKPYKRIPFFVDRPASNPLPNGKIRKSAFSIPIPTLGQDLFMNYTDTTVSYFTEWKAIGMGNNVTTITRKEGYIAIITKEPVTFDSETYTVAQELVTKMGYELIFAPQYQTKRRYHNIHYHFITGGLGDNATKYDKNEIISTQVEFATIDFEVPSKDDLENGSLGFSVIGYELTGWRLSESGGTIYTEDEIKKEIWNLDDTSGALHIYGNFIKRKYGIYYKYYLKSGSLYSTQTFSIEYGTDLNILSPTDGGPPVKGSEGDYSTISDVYTFKGWRDNETGIEYLDGESLVVEKATGYEAYYESRKRQYEVNWYVKYKTSSGEITEPLGGGLVNYGAELSPPTKYSYAKELGDKTQVFMGFDNPSTCQGEANYYAIVKTKVTVKDINWSWTSQGVSSSTHNLTSTSGSGFSGDIEWLYWWYSRKITINTSKITALANYANKDKAEIFKVVAKFKFKGGLRNINTSEVFLGSDFDISSRTKSVLNLGTDSTLTVSSSDNFSLTLTSGKSDYLGRSGSPYFWIGYHEGNWDTQGSFTFSDVYFDITFVV